MLSIVPAHKAGAQELYPLLKELISYLCNCTSIKFFPVLGYNLSPISLISDSFGDTENKPNPSVILQTVEIAAIFH